MYPIVIIDNFFEDPDAIVEMANQLNFFPTETGNYPGCRTKNLDEIVPDFFYFFGNKVHKIFYETIPEYWNMSVSFQKILPFHKDQYNKKNRGWIHKDNDHQFGGIVYLTKNPDPDSGTSIYMQKMGFSNQKKENISAKENFYLNKSNLEDKEFDKLFDEINEQYIETIKVENVYNRLFLFGSTTYHGVKTFGTKERLTLNFFGNEMTGKTFPLLR